MVVTGSRLSGPWSDIGTGALEDLIGLGTDYARQELLEDDAPIQSAPVLFVPPGYQAGNGQAAPSGGLDTQTILLLLGGAALLWWLLK